MNQEVNHLRIVEKMNKLLQERSCLMCCSRFTSYTSELRIIDKQIKILSQQLLQINYPPKICNDALAKIGEFYHGYARCTSRIAASRLIPDGFFLQLARKAS